MSSKITTCFDCKMQGVNIPGNKICGNCGSQNTVTAQITHKSIIKRADKNYLVSVSLETVYQLLPNSYNAEELRQLLDKTLEFVKQNFENLQPGEAYVYFSPLIEVKEI